LVSLMHIIFIIYFQKKNYAEFKIKSGRKLLVVIRLSYTILIR